MKVLIIAEDPTYDQFIVKPIVKRLLEDCEVQGTVDVLTDPHMKGVSMALDANILAKVVAENPMVDLFIVVADRDCNRENNQNKAAARAAEHDNLLCTLAAEEIEVWMLALHRETLNAKWSDVRSHCDPKEKYAEPFLRNGNFRGPGKGRKRAMDALAGRWQGLLQVCEELGQLRTEIDMFFNSP